MAGDETVTRESRSSSVGGRRHRSKAGATAIAGHSTSAPASNAASSVSSPAPGKRKKRRTRRSKKALQLNDSVSMDGQLSRSSELINSAVSSDTDSSLAAASPAPDHTPSGAVSDSTMTAPHGQLGRNRLAVGFTRPRPLPDPRSQTSEPPRKTISSVDSTGTTSQDAIELSDSDSDEEMDVEDGGMVVNLVSSESAQSDQEMDDGSEEGEVIQQLHGEPSHSTSNDLSAAPAQTKRRLADLDPDQVEDQIRYGFYHLDPQQIDLNRFVLCLACFQEGHMADECHEINCKHCDRDPRHSSRSGSKVARCDRCQETPHPGKECKPASVIKSMPCDICNSKEHGERQCPQRFFAAPSLNPSTPRRLWISCCRCASNSHLVGDCPEMVEVHASRWSLKSLDPSQITNLSLETGTRTREREVENRGMRPPGLQIKGRAGRYQSGTHTSFQDSDDEQDSFIRPSVKQRGDQDRPRVMMSNYQPRPPPSDSPRYDRYDAPTQDRNYNTRGRGAWYDTDSFGQRPPRRSRSPPPYPADRWRSRRTPSPRQGDSYRPNQGPQQSDYWQRRPSDRAFDNRPPGPPSSLESRPQSENRINIQLPTRKSSNPNLNRGPTSGDTRNAVRKEDMAVGSKKGAERRERGS